jgi:hypothetical protein
MRFPFGYYQATQALSERGWKAWTTNEWIFQSYLGEDVCKPSPKTLQELLDGHAEGFRALVVDVHPLMWELAEEIGIKHEEDLARLSVLKAVQEKAEPIAVFPNPGTATTDLTFEVLFHYDDAFKVGERIRKAGADTIRIYDLKPFYDGVETGSEGDRSTSPSYGRTSRKGSYPSREGQ